MEQKEVLLDVQNVSVTFGSGKNKFEAVHHVSFQVHRGETFGIVGESGSGKTTIGRSIMRIYPTSSGEILYKGQKINAGDPEPTFFLPAALTVIESEAFSGITARAVVIPKTVTSISGNPFSGSSVTTVYGYAGSAAQALAAAQGYTFVTIDDAWMASH